MSSRKTDFPELINIDDTIIESDILQEQFICDLDACKGACCVAGDSGAPLMQEELSVLDRIYEQVKPYMRKEGRKAVAKQGRYVLDEGDFATPLVEGKECAYVFFDESGCAKCAIEAAFRDGKTDFIKPVSCHLYPIRIDPDRSFLRLKYERWSICKAACRFGKKQGVRLFEFLKEPLIRRFGHVWYDTLCAVAEHYGEKPKAKDTP